MEHDLMPVNVVPETPPAKAEAILAFAGSHARELLNAVSARPVVGIGFEDGERAPVHPREVWVSSRELAIEALEMRGSEDPKCRHYRRRRAFAARLAFGGSRSASAGRLLPARYSAWLLRISAPIFGLRSSR